MCLAALEEGCGLHTAVVQHCQFIHRIRHPSCLCTWAFHGIQKGKEKETDEMREGRKEREGGRKKAGKRKGGSGERGA